MTFNFPKQREHIDLSDYLQDEPTIGQSNCEDCPLGAKRIPTQGLGKKKILIVVSHPSKGDAMYNDLEHSHVYNMLAGGLLKHNIDIHKDCWVTSAVNCYPNALVPTKKMYQSCRGNLLATVQELKPLIVLLAGRNATHGWIGHLFNVTPRIPDYKGYKHDTDYEMWTGQTIPDQQYSFTVDGKECVPLVIPLHNAHDIVKSDERNRQGRGVQSVLVGKHAGIMQLVAHYSKELLEKGYIPKSEPLVKNVQRVYSPDLAVNILKELNIPSIIAFDYETTGIKPYNSGHKIVTVGISNGKTTYAIPFFDHHQGFLDAFKAFMTNPEVKKVCHNLKFEYNWTRAILGYEMEGVLWDTMLAAHILDMRDGLTSLKMQGYLQFGVAGYDKATKLLLQAKDRTQGSNGINLLQYLYADDISDNVEVWDTLLDYVGVDARLTYDLYIKQKELFLATDYKHLLKGMKLFMESTISLAEMEFNGFRFNTEQWEKNKELIKEHMVSLDAQMLETEEYKKWLEKYPKKPLNTNSPKQLQEFFFDILGHEPTQFTNSGAPSTNKEALSNLDSEYARLLLEYKALDKMLNSFLVNYKAEANEDGRLRCFYNLHTVKSYRTSSSDVNLQNVSQHYEISQYALNLLGPSEGHILLSADFKSLEVFCASAHTKDPKLAEYLHDATTDMHRDVACDIHSYNADELPKRLRTLAKKFVFGAFYGAGYRSITYNQWQGMEYDDKQRLKEHNINNYNEFEAHIQNIFNYFWNVRFKQYTRWKQRQWSFYTKYGYFMGHTGFMYNGICNVNQTSNFGIQGDASHLLLQEANYMYKYLKELGLDSKLIGQVHDSLLISVRPDELPLILKGMQVFLSEITTHNEWAEGLDFAIEVEVSEVNGHWGNMKEIALIRGSGIEQLGA